MMKLTDKHIEQLFDFTRKHFVEHYDIQAELVDHLANDIEDIWLDKPDLTFEKARDLSFKKFGVFGFMDVYENKKKQMSKKYMRIMWRFFKEWFELPKIILTLSMVLGCNYLFGLANIGKYFFYSLVFIAFVICFYKTFKFRKERKQKFKENSRILLLEDMIFTLATGNMLVLLSNIYNIIYLPMIFYRWGWLLLSSFITVSLIVVFYIVLFVISERSHEFLEKEYPGYKFVD